jgi:hypothetical protein
MREPISADQMLKVCAESGYLIPKLLPTGEWACLSPFLFTWGLMVGVDESGYRTRFCYENLLEAAKAICTWDGVGDPPGNWIKEKGGVERSNPNFKGIDIVEETV